MAADFVSGFGLGALASMAKAIGLSALTADRRLTASTMLRVRGFD
jgi:hypothetical protein